MTLRCWYCGKLGAAHFFPYPSHVRCWVDRRRGRRRLVGGRVVEAEMSKLGEPLYDVARWEREDAQDAEDRRARAS